MSWTKYFHTAPTKKRSLLNSSNKPNIGFKNYSSNLPEYYSGHPNRIERYLQYDAMDQDSEINAALDILAEFCTQNNVEDKMSFKIHYHDENATETEIAILLKELRHWSNLQDFKCKIFKIVRNVFKNGDQLFIRDPETQKWHFIDSANVEKIIVDEAVGKKIEQYVIRDVGVNFESMAATEKTTNVSSSMPGLLNRQGGTGNAAGAFQVSQGPMAIDATHIVHISLTEEMDMSWPFGRSLLEDVFKVYKQKELLEDAIIIYRVQRAPERRVFYIDVGDMPSHLAMAFIDRVKNEIHQRRIPSQTGGNSQIMDSTYNPMCLALDTNIPLLDDRILTLTELIEEYKNKKENWTYSCDPKTGKIVPGKITWAGITQKNTQVIKLWFNDGSFIIVTPDHKIPVLGKGFIKAKDLTKSDLLISYKTREHSIELTVDNMSYTHQIYDHELNEWVYSHKIIDQFFKDNLKYLNNSDLNYWKTLFNLEIKKINKKNIESKCDNLIDDEQHEFNRHLIQKIWLEETQDTGTITIDGNENYFNYHTFPVNNSIFVKNSIMEDYFFPQTGEGRGSKVETLPGGDNLGQIDDLKHFSNKLFRALRIPSSYLPTGPDEGVGNLSDGRLGTALIQEYRFNEYCKRLQNIISKSFDKEFKLFLKIRGINIDNSIFELIFNEPQNFASYKQADLDASRLSSFSQIESLPYISKRFAMKRFLGLSNEEMLENSKLWNEENPEESSDAGDKIVGGDLRNVGISAGDIDAGLDDAELPDDFDVDGEDNDLEVENDDVDVEDLDISAEPDVEA